jgi:hypothetical protein
MKLTKISGWIALAAVALLATACWVTPRSTTPTPAPASEESLPPDDPSTRVASHKTPDLVQPVKIESPPIDTGDPDGVEGGVEDDGMNDLVGVSPSPPPPPPPPLPPKIVPPLTLEAGRIAGEKNIVPDDITKTEISRSGKDRLVGSYKLCITVEGNVRSVSQLKSTGFPAYDAKIMNTIRGEWRYLPFLVNDPTRPGSSTPVAVCTAVTFIYRQIAPPSPPPPSKT